MKAAYYNRYGPADVLQYGELPDPTPRRGQVLVRVRACALNPKDVLVRQGKFRLFTGRRFPRVSGYDLAGEVVEVGRGVKHTAVGDAVFGMIQSWDAGACAELAALPETELASRPRCLDWKEAASLPLAALTALQALRDLLCVSAGDQVCINGASGGVGTVAVQIASILGGVVTGICSSRNEELLRGLGAEDVLPHDQVELLASGRRFDVFFDVFGNRPFEQARPLLSPGGRYATTIPKIWTILMDWGTRWNRQPARLVVVRSRRSDLEQLTSWVEADRLRPVVDRVWPLASSAEAHTYLGTRRARGKVVLVP